MFLICIKKEYTNWREQEQNKENLTGHKLRQLLETKLTHNKNNRRIPEQ